MAFVVDMRDTECPNQTYVISVWWYTVRAADQTQVSGSAWFPLSFPNYFFISVFLVEESSDTAPGSLILQAFFSLRLKSASEVDKQWSHNLSQKLYAGI